jgi:acyl carrier protein
MTSNDDRLDISAKIEDALSEVLMREVTGLPEDTRLFEDLQLDSTAILELLMALEDNLGFEVDPDNLDMADFKTIGTLTGYITSALAVRA